MRKNVIILTSGLSGSSVLTALIARAGYWFGNETKKLTYDTYENSTLVNLNIRLFQACGCPWDDPGGVAAPAVEQLRHVSDDELRTECMKFVEECEMHSPWLWKDPRLCFTIGFWSQLVDTEGCRFVVMTREVKQMWAGAILRGHFRRSIVEMARMQANSIEAAHRFLNSRPPQDWQELSFEELLLHPSRSVDQLNTFLNIDLKVSDLEEVYTGPLGKKRWSSAKYIEAKTRSIVNKMRVAVRGRLAPRGGRG